MRKKIVLLSALCSLTATCALGLYGCSFFPTEEEPQTPSVTYEFTGLDVIANATEEVGSYYEFEKPTVLVGEEKANVTVVVKYGEKNIPHDNTQVYLDVIGEYSVIYTASYDGQSTSKVTKVTTEDTTSPVFVNTLYRAVRYDEEIVLSDYVIARDFSGIQTCEYTVTKENGEALPEGSFDKMTKTLTVSDESIRKVKVKLSATDVYGNASVSEEFVLSMSPTPTYGKFGFAWFETGATEVGGVFVEANAINEWTTQIKEEEGVKYLSVTVTTAQTNQYVYVDLTESLIGDFSNFDFLDVEMRLTATANGGNGGMKGAEFAAKPSNIKQENSNIFLEHKDEWFAYRYEGEAAFEAVEKNGGVYLLFKPWGAQTVTIDIKSVTGGYKTLKVEKEQSIDWQSLGLSVDDLTNVTYNGVSVEDITSFVPSRNGTLEFVLKKDGYKNSPITLEVQVVATAVEDGEEIDNDFEWQW